MTTAVRAACSALDQAVGGPRHDVTRKEDSLRLLSLSVQSRIAHCNMVQEPDPATSQQQPRRTLLLVAQLAADLEG